jgi:hypothetical protein
MKYHLYRTPRDVDNVARGQAQTEAHHAIEHQWKRDQILKRCATNY